MKIKLNIFVLSACLFVFLGCASAASAQTEPILGGYSKTSVSDDEVVAAAKFAVKRRARTTKSNISLFSIKNAQIQVVAGLNYRICLQVNVKRKSKKTAMQSVEAVVYRDLKNSYSLTSWTEKACEEE